MKPGPGTYTIDALKTMKREASWKIGTAERTDPNIKEKMRFTTGPGKYSPNIGAIKVNAARWKFGAEKRPDVSPKGLSRNPSP
jgi:hypothetical protein